MESLSRANVIFESNWNEQIFDSCDIRGHNFLFKRWQVLASSVNRHLKNWLTPEIGTLVLQNPCWQTIWRIFTNLRWLWHVYSSQYWYQSWGALGTGNTAVTAAIEFNCTNVNTPVTSASRPEHSNYSSLPRVSQYFNYARAHDQSRYLHTLSVPSRDRDSQYCH